MGTGSRVRVLVGMVVLGLLSSMLPVGAASDVGWGTAQLIEYDDVSHGFYPDVAVDGLGNAIAVWQQSDGAVFNICSNRYVVGSGWGTVQLIETDDSGDAMYPRAAVNEDGNTFAVWYQHDGVRFNIWSNRYVTGSGWGGMQLIETDNSGSALYPQIAVDSSGNATAVWHQYDGIRENIWANRYTVGSGWGIAQLIETDNSGSAGYPQIAVDSSGNATAVWHQYDGSRDSIWANRYVVGSGWGIAQLIEDDSSGSALRPQVAVDDQGSAIVVWIQHDGAQYNTWSNRYVVESGWGTAQLIETNDSGSAMYPQVAADGEGNAVAVWYQFDGIRDNIWANQFAIGIGWSTAQLIETDDSGPAYDPQVTVDDHGNAIAVWHQHDGVRYNICSSRYVVGTGWDAAQIIEIYNSGNAQYPQVAGDGSGNSFAVWQQYDGTRTNIYSNLYVAPDIIPPALTVSNPLEGMTTESSVIIVSGTTEPGVTLNVNGLLVAVESNGSFICGIALADGPNTIVVTATDAAGNSAEVTVSVTYVNPIWALEELLQTALAQMAILESHLNNVLLNVSAVQDSLDAALAELDDMDVRLDDAISDMTDLRERLGVAESELASVQSELEAISAVLDAVETDLENTGDDIVDIQTRLENALVNLTAVQAELDDVFDELETMEGELDSLKDEQPASSDDVEDMMRLQILVLLVVLAVVAVLAIIMLTMYFGLRKRVSRNSNEPAEKDAP